MIVYRVGWQCRPRLYRLTDAKVKTDGKKRKTFLYL